MYVCIWAWLYLCVYACVSISCAGVLCGKCNDGYSLSALLNKCVTCDSAFTFVIPLLGMQCYWFCSCPDISILGVLISFVYSVGWCGASGFDDSSVQSSLPRMALPMSVLCSGQQQPGIKQALWVLFGVCLNKLLVLILCQIVPSFHYRTDSKWFPSCSSLRE